MDWIRRNWPDLLIGIALLAVIGGIIATLLNGGSFFTPTQTPPTVATPQPTQTQPTATQPSPPTPPTDADAPEDTGATPTTGTDAVIPVIPSLEGDGPAEPAPAEPEAITPVQPTGSPPPQTPPSPPAPTPPASTPPTAQVSTDPFRISVGSFGVPENAERRAAEFRNAGYPVFIAPQGDLSIVLVGPYASRAEAEQARNAIVSAGLESNPQIFEFTGETTVQQTGAPTPTQATPSPTPAPTPTTGSGSLIQVGAYGSSQSAQPQRQRLEALGFSVSELQEGALVKLVIGPFAGDDLAEVRSRLTAQGIDHFVR